MGVASTSGFIGVDQLERNMNVIHDAHEKNRLVGFEVWKGRVVSYDYSKFNIFQRIANWIYQGEQKELAQILANEVAESLHSSSYKPIKEKIIAILTADAPILFNPSPKVKKLDDLFYRAIVRAFKNDSIAFHELTWGEKNSAIYTKYLNNFLKSSTPTIPITLYESREFLEFRHNIKINNDSLLTPQEKRNVEDIYRNLSEYFQSTLLTDEFEDMEIEMKRDLIFNLTNKHSIFNNESFKEFVNDVCHSIKHKIHDPISISGHPRQLINDKDVKFLNQLEDILLYFNHLRIPLPSIVDSSDMHIQLEKFNNELSNHRELFARLEDLKIPPTSEQLPLVIEAKQALLQMELSDIGRKFNLKDFRNSEIFDQSLTHGLDKLFQCKEVRGEEVDLAVINALCQEHDKATIHPKVAIEGAGPTGLLLALTQYQVGADVTVFEKRSTDYDRTQVVRLDPKWVNMLQFYLGEKFFRIFEDSNHRGIIRSDGFAEIVTYTLEGVLTERLAELRSVAAPNTFEEFAAHEVKKVTRPEVPGGKFKVSAVYNRTQDKFGNTPKEDGEEREVDFLFCAGGKSSALTKTFLPSSNPVNERQYYGVCSWISPDYQAFDKQNIDKMNYFEDFRGIIKIDLNLINNFKNEAIQSIAKSVGDSKKALDLFGPLDIVEWKKRPFLQTRTFENRGLIYIGMELPTALENLIERLTNEMKEYSPALKEQVLVDVKAAWYNQIGKNYKLSDDLKIDNKFMAAFPVEQNRLSANHLFSEVKAGDARLLITAAGDAFASPHFMRYSGLTGGRECINYLQNYMNKHINHFYKEESLLQELREKGERTAQFVIGRGAAFLQSRHPSKISSDRIDYMSKTLDEAIKNWTDPKSILRFVSKHNYTLQHKDQVYSLIPKDGYFNLVGIDGTRQYESFEQIKLMLDIK